MGQDDPTVPFPQQPQPPAGEAETTPPQSLHETAGHSAPPSIGPYRLLTPLGAGGMGEVWIAEQTEPVKRRVALKLIKRGLGSKEIILSGSTAEEVSTITGQRQTDSVRLQRILAGDLDWIVMKALEKDRGRRYESASGFAADIHRYLNNEPVSARPPSLQYRMQKFVRKNRVGVAASLLVLLALLAGITGTSLALYRALQAEELAEVRLADADRARDAEFRQRQLAEQRQLEAEREKQIAQDAARRELEARIAEEKQRNFAEAINRFVRDDFLALTSVEGRARFGGEGLDRHSTLTELLQRAARKLQARSDLAPEIEAELAWMIGVNLRANGEAQQATSFLERAVQLLGETQGSDAEITWDARGSLAVAHLEAGNFDQAIQLHDQAFHFFLAQRGPSDPMTLGRQASLAAAYLRTGQADKAMPLWEQALAGQRLSCGVDHDDTLWTMVSLSEGYRTTGQLDQAIEIVADALKMAAAKWPPNHPLVLSAKNNLAVCWQTQKRFDQSIPLLEEIMQQKEQVFGEDHPETWEAMQNVAIAYNARGRLKQAIPLLTRVLELRTQKLGALHPQTLKSRYSVAQTHFYLREYETARTMLEPVLQQMTLVLGPDHPETLACLNSLGSTYFYMSDYDNAREYLQQAVDLMTTRHGRNHAQTVNAMFNLANTHMQRGDYIAGLKWGRELLPPATEVLGPDNPMTTMSHHLVLGASAHVEIMIDQEFTALTQSIRDSAAAEVWKPQLSVLLEHLRFLWAAEPRRLATGMAKVAKTLLDAEQWSEAEPVVNEAWQLRRLHEPDAWTTFNLQSVLGGVWLKLGRAAQAEAMIVAGYQGLQERQDKIPAGARSERLREALDRAIAVYTELQQPEQVAKYQTLRDAAPSPQSP